MNHILIKGSSKGTIVFIHGNSSSSKVFRAVLESDLIQQTKIAVDLPGHGLSNKDYVEDKDFSFNSYKKKLLNLIESIDDDILLVGNSLGGLLAIEIAKDIERLKGLVIFATPPLKKPLNLEEAFLPVPELQTFFTENPSDLEIELAAKATVYNKDLVPAIQEQFCAANPKVRKALAIDVGNEVFENEYEIFTKLDKPRFIIAGRQDPSVNLIYLQKMVENCHEDCELIMFEDCGHFPSLEKPQEFIITLKGIAAKVF